VAVIIPAPNEENSLPLVLADLPEVARVVAVDNGLDDHTAAVAAEGGTDVVGQPQHACGTAWLRGLPSPRARARLLVRVFRRDMRASCAHVFNVYNWKNITGVNALSKRD